MFPSVTVGLIWGLDLPGSPAAPVHDTAASRHQHVLRAKPQGSPLTVPRMTKGGGGALCDVGFPASPPPLALGTLECVAQPALQGVAVPRGWCPQQRNNSPILGGDQNHSRMTSIFPTTLFLEQACPWTRDLVT